jgi:hypothetical protein
VLIGMIGAAEIFATEVFAALVRSRFASGPHEGMSRQIVDLLRSPAGSAPDRSHHRNNGVGG